MIVSTFVLAENSEGAPEILHLSVDCSESIYRDGGHYDAASQYVSGLGYSVLGVFDEAGRAIDGGKLDVCKRLTV